jgi:hypothetical protein
MFVTPWLATNNPEVLFTVCEATIGLKSISKSVNRNVGNIVSRREGNQTRNRLNNLELQSEPP